MLFQYHGGTNLGRTSGGPYITTTYDYIAPLDEFGNLAQSKYGHLKELHDVLHSMEKILTGGNVTNTDTENSVAHFRSLFMHWTGKEVVSSAMQMRPRMQPSHMKVQYNVPVWSVTILPDCTTEVYNTAKVNTQTKKSNDAESEPASLQWSWRPERIDEAEGVNLLPYELLDQKVVSDTSDYMWYMINVYIGKDDPIWSDDMTLRINGSGHVLHAYVNGQYLGSEWATYGIFNYVFEKKVKLNPGRNLISLLSATVGLQNYGPHFDTIQSGIAGPVEIIGKKGDESIIKDLSAHKWSYKVAVNCLLKIWMVLVLKIY
ncbi:hypothetical protein K7X08_012021 [Anisodus acutangulus]|uniref:beta-galactosidase n=1 Tax=Anisodus acutangulus TaxID=402998 RepID=A0A9Q1LC29_9SOLA|nr:hypothetical protein K7X08_012021 [Anisodus acutangulus]